ncbi:CNT family concentrative nucleoside transporter [Myriangium duriaei CBS 260.36]|uniref:CNT family concentrative nucleoside transporter n=1 Tax=Myriangium duriaei CBS 260.36 TaxID=1168546 RepID=A0A9P4J7U7_9PEZI|nr:CNT family concentrative nucleoside transporter [Myriangium duriaei CBS 260.36]
MTHNSSLQTGVVPSTDPALDTANEHNHEHLHHGASSLDRNRHEDVVYASGPGADAHSIPSTAVPHEKTDGLHQRHVGTDNSSPADIEKGAVGYNVSKNELGYNENSASEELDPQHHGFARFYKHYRIVFHAFLAMLFTGWWIASLVLHRHDKNWVIPFLFWLCIMLRVVFWWVPISYVSRPIKWTWRNTGSRVSALIPQKFGIPLGALLVLAVIIVGSMASAETGDNTRANRAISIFGIIVMTFLFWATSRNRRKIVWHTVIVGYLIQFIIALFVLRTSVGVDIFRFVSDRAVDLLHSANAGVTFLFDSTVPNEPWFFTGVIPPIIFFVAVVQVLYYWGFIQWFVGKVAHFFFWSLRVSGAEAVVASATPFIGQGESAMLIKPFVPHLTKAEIHQVMTSGFATIAGSVLVAYIGLGVNPQALISSCVMSIPASLAFSKLRYPEEEESLTAGRVVVPEDEEHRAANVLHAFANGAWLGIKIAGMIVATLLCIIALVALINALLTWWGRYINLDGNYDLTLQLILGYLFFPIAWLLGVSGKDDIIRVARLIGVKIIQNEFVAFNALTHDPAYASLSGRSRLIATYAVCGFGNFGSLGTQIGVLSQISPGRSGDVSRVAMSALFTGIFSTLSSASIAGMVVQNQKTLFTPPGSDAKVPPSA